MRAGDRDGRVWTERAAKLFCLCAAVGVGVFCIKYILPAAAPLIFAYFVSAAVYSVSGRLSALLRLPYGVCAVAVLAAAVFVLGGGLFFACGRLMREIVGVIGVFAKNSSQDTTPIFRALEELPLISSLAGVYEQYLVGELSPAVCRVLSSLLERLGEFMGRAVRATPSAVMGGVITLIICFYMSVYHREVGSFLASLIPKGARERVLAARRGVFSTLGGYLKAYAKLFALTFFEVLVGFLLLCPSYALLGALCVATVDILPVLGAGLVLIPWGSAAILRGDVFLGVGMLILYAVVTVVRQIAEPKLVGEAVGLHPLVSVVAMFLGYRLFGVAGMMLAPIAAVCVKGCIGGDFM